MVKKSIATMLTTDPKVHSASECAVERLTSVAIIRNGKTHHGHKSHWQLRAELGDADPYKSIMSDDEGFYTDTGRFVSRIEAIDIACASGQLDRPLGRKLLSSDLNWDVTP